jgi:hypothetical protein
MQARAFLTISMLAAMSICAQTPNGQVTGIVYDQAGARLEQAIITARNAETASERVVHPDLKGEYRFESLPAGKYSIRASAKGLTTVQINDVLVQNNKVATINVTLPESRTTPISVVQVSEAPEPIDTAPAAISVPHVAPSPAPVAPAPIPAADAEDAKTMDPKLVVGEINAVRDRLALSADQQIRAREIIQQRQVQVAAIRHDTSLVPADRREKIKAVRLDADAKFRALLNENQIDEYDEILRERRERALQRKQP